MYDVTGDLSADETHRKTGDSQSVLFEAHGTSHIPVSAADMHTLGLHHGTFMTLNGECDLDVEGAEIINMASTKLGDAFDTVAGVDSPVLPFRTYWYNSSSSVKGQTRAVYIVDGGMEGTEPEPDIDTTERLTFSVENLTVTVTNGFDEDKLITVHLPAGELVMRHMASPGRTTFRLPKNGLYIINGKKVLTR